MNIRELSISSGVGYERPLMIVNADLSLRYDMAAHCLGENVPYTLAAEIASREQKLLDMLTEPYGNVVTVMPAEDTRKQLNSLVTSFKEEAHISGRTPLIVSLDPAFLDPSLADYSFQETRVSLVEPKQMLIDLEHNPRGHANRFLQPVGPTNGAGKAVNEQVQDIRRIIDQQEAPIALALVEDYVNTGGSILNRFKEFIKNPDIQTTVITGLVNSMTSRHLGEQLSIVSTFEVPDGIRIRHMDMSDMIPTLGGRVIGWSQGSDIGENNPYTIGRQGQRVPLAVDAICGNYPWQIDMYSEDTTPAYLHKLGDVCLDAAHTFWTSLEEITGGELLWNDLTIFSGVLRTYYPVKDLTHCDAYEASFRPAPRGAIEAIMAREDKS